MDSAEKVSFVFQSRILINENLKRSHLKQGSRLQVGSPAEQSVARMSTALEPRARDQASERPGTNDACRNFEIIKSRRSVSRVVLVDRAVR